MIECVRCGVPADEETGFHSNGRGGRRGACKDCEHKRVANLRARGLCGGHGHGRRPTTSKQPAKQPVPRQPIKQKAPSAKTYVITYAQNATPVHEEFLASLKQYCAHNRAKLLVIPGRYRNPTSIWSDRMEHDEWWVKEVHPYLFDGRMTLGEHIGVFGDIPIQPTASRPLTEFEVFVGNFSGIFGHPRLQFKTVATAIREYPRILTTTGAVTVANYTSSKAGKKAEAHHVFGACVVEEDGERFHVRQLNAKDDGTFIDIDTEYTPEGPRPAEDALALVCGDIHEAYSVREVLDATLYAEDSILRATRARKVVCHDVLHFDARNHHSIHDFKDRYDRQVAQERIDSVEEEVLNSIRFLDGIPGDDTEVIAVAANHDEAFDRWLEEANPKEDPLNARFYHEVWTETLRRKEQTSEWIPAFELCYGLFSQTHRATFIRRNEPLKAGDVFLNFHGDKGTNGGKGSAASYAKLGIKTITGHHHSPQILDGAYVTGVTGDLDQRYNHLPSSWMYSHVVEYANGKRCIISVVNGAWRAKRGRTRARRETASGMLSACA